MVLLNLSANAYSDVGYATMQHVTSGTWGTNDLIQLRNLEWIP